MRRMKKTIQGIIVLAAAATAVWAASASIFINFPSISPNGDGIKDEMTVSVHLSSMVDTLLVTIEDKLSPSVYDTLAFEAPADTGHHTEIWDGTDWTGTVLPEGSYDLRVYESTGGTGESLMRTVIIDLTSPQVNIDRIEPGVFSPGWPDTSAAVDVYFTVSGWETGAAARLTLRNPSGIETTSSVDVQGDGEWTGRWKPDMAETGFHSVIITVADEAGNSDSDSGFVFVDSDGPELEFSKADLYHLVDLYDDEIAYFDSQFGVLMDELRRRGLIDNTVIVVASDHGEDFYQEHGHVKHCHSLYDAVTRTPLMMRIPGVDRVRPVEVQVENVDIVPTILDYLGIDQSGLELEGVSLRPAIESDRQVHDHVFSLQDDLRSANDGRFKLITALSTGDNLLFDLQEDPRETEDLFRLDLESAAGLRQALSGWRDRYEAGIGAEQATRAAEAAKERLRAIGYLQ